MSTVHRRLAGALVAAVAGIVLALALVEAILQLSHRYRDVLVRTPLRELVALTDPPFSWERRFLENYARGEMVYEGLHQPHPTRGWALVPGRRVERGPVVYTTNRQGFRSTHDFESSPDRYEIIVVGDSFTFGDEVTDAATWPEQLQQLDARLNVLNMGGTGYGVDQMYLTLAEEAPRYRPRLVVAAFIGDDLYRSQLDFRDFKKPRFVLAGDRLLLTNTPIGTIDDVRREIANRPVDDYSALQTLNVVRRLRGTLRSTKALPTGCGPECFALNVRLFDAIGRLARDAEADFMIVSLPVGPELVGDATPTVGETLLDAYRLDRDGAFVDLRGPFEAAGFAKTLHHYDAAENALVATSVHRAIADLPSWRAFDAAHHAAEPAHPTDDRSATSR